MDSQYILISWEDNSIKPLSGGSEAEHWAEAIDGGDADVLEVSIDKVRNKISIRRAVVGSIEDQDGNATDEFEIAEWELMI